MKTAEEIADGLSPLMEAGLLRMNAVERSSYALRAPLNTLDALHRRGLVARRAMLGHMFSPQTNLLWSITQLGRDVKLIIEARNEQ